MNKLYFIRAKGTLRPLGVRVFSNEGGEFCNSTGAEWDRVEGAPVYCQADLGTAVDALREDPHWYNSSVDRPQWPEWFNPNNYEVVSVDFDKLSSK